MSDPRIYITKLEPLDQGSTEGTWTCLKIKVTDSTGDTYTALMNPDTLTEERLKVELLELLGDETFLKILPKLEDLLEQKYEDGANDALM